MADNDEQTTNPEETMQPSAEAATRKLGSEFYEEIREQDASQNPENSTQASYGND